MNSLTEIEQMHVFTSFPEDAQDEENNEVSIIKVLFFPLNIFF